MLPTSCNLNLSLVKTELCIFCYKTVDSCATSRKNADSVLIKFVKFSERFLGRSKDSLYKLSLDICKNNKFLGYCKDCGIIINTFCDLYHQLKCIELQLEWKLDTLVKVMKLANKVPSSIKHLREIFDFDRSLEEEPGKTGSGGCKYSARIRLKTFKSFRTEFQAKCAQKHLTSTPQVVLNPLKNATTPNAPVPVAGSYLKLECSSLNTSSEERVPISTQATSSQNESSELFLGWTMSLAAVFLLASTSTTTTGRGILPETFSGPDGLSGVDGTSLPSSPSNDIFDNDDADPTENVIHEKTIEKEVEMDIEPFCDNKSLLIPKSADEVLEELALTELTNDIFFSDHESYSQDDVSLAAGQEEDLRDPLEMVGEQTEIDNSEDKGILAPIIASIEGNPTNHSLAAKQLPSPKLTGNAPDKRDGSIVLFKRRKFDCKACKISFSTYNCLRRHRQGKRHNLMFNRYQKKQSPEMKSNTTGDAAVGVTIKTTRKSGKLAEKRFAYKKKSQDSKPRRFSCTNGSRDCNYMTNIKIHFENHQKLHQPGEFKCHFCDVIETSVINLANHERIQHPFIVENANESQVDILYCPRLECTYETARESAYHWHFAEVHVGGFAKIRRGKLVECRICRLNVLEHKQDYHFKRSHDISGMGQTKTWNCEVEGCSAYFKTRYQYRYHRKRIHLKISEFRNPLKPKKKLNNPSFDCEFCDKKFRHRRLLDNHKQKHHRNRENIESDVGGEVPEDFVEVTAATDVEEEHNEETCSIPKRYNLRQSGKRSYQNMDEDVDMEGKDESFGLSDSDTAADVDDEGSEDSDSIESDSSNSSHSEWDSEVETVPLSKRVARSKKYHKIYESCNFDDCNYNSRSTKCMEDHLKLHSPGEFKCNFCDVMETSVMELSRHERIQHSSVVEGYFPCARCPYKTTMMSYYEWHFAEAHIGGFERRSQVEECNVCNKRVQRGKLDRHFQNCHDLSDMEGKKIWRCNIENCSAYFKNEDQKRSHKIVVHEIKPRPVGPKKICEICKLCFQEGNESEHFKTYHDTFGMARDQIPKCDVEGCPAYFRTYDQLFKHKQKIHQQPLEEIDDEEVIESERKKSFKCKLCNKKFVYPSLLQRHKIIFHKKQNPEAPPPKTRTHSFFICPEVHCTKKVRNLKDLETHRKLHGKFKCKFCDTIKDYAPDLALHESEHAVRPPETSTNKEFIHCPRCPETYERKGHFIRHHLENHMNLTNARFTCPICNAQGLDRKFVYNHTKSHHKTDGLDPSKISRCDLCPAYFIRGNQLIMHKVKVHTEKRNTCPECGKEFKAPSLLRIHMEKTHSNFLPSLKFPCKVENCKKRFATEQELESHERTHEKVRQGIVKCDQCSKEFRGDARLKAHVEKVHCSLSHMCTECGKAFKTKLGLHTHMEYHKDPDSWKFQCSQCGRKFVTKQKLEQHQRTHTKEKPFVCQYCGNKYAHNHNLRNHVKTHHNDEEEEDGAQSDEEPRKGNYLSRKGSKKGVCIVSGVVKK